MFQIATSLEMCIYRYINTWHTSKKMTLKYIRTYTKTIEVIIKLNIKKSNLGGSKKALLNCIKFN